MRKTLTPHLFLLALFLLAHHAGFSQTSFWQKSNRAAPQVASGPATRYLTLLTDLSGLRSYLASDGAAARGGGRSISLPLPDGSFAEVALEPAAVLVPEMQAEHPEIQTFRGTSADGRYAVRLTISPYGAAGRMSTPEGVVYIQPLTPATPEWSAVFFARDAERPAGTRCLVQEDMEEDPAPAAKTNAFSYGDANLRTYVLAVACTGEYTVWAGSQAAALMQITTTVNNVNEIYERDLGITFTLTSPAAIRYTDSTTDPYTRTLGSSTLTANQTAIDAAVTNYDLGHVFGAQWSGGLAQLSSVCGVSKARAASGLDPAIFTTTGPSGPVFDGTVAHEIGHQFSATHSFAANNSSCNGNTQPSTGWEPGGGSTIMAYAGTCTPNFYQFNADLYFHGGNLSQMSTFMQGTGNSCAALTTPSNSAPSISVSPLSFTIPHSTPFRLTGTATDANNPSALTYTYEQVDPVGTATSSAPSPTSTTGPQFRSFPPSASATRYLPNLASLFTGASTPYEVLPAVSRTMNFRATVRDNNGGFGRTAGENIVVTTSTCGPFSITSQTSASSFTANGTNTMTVTWNTAAACVPCANVTLKLTRDGGSSFTTLLASTPNDGSETFTVPNLVTCDGRLYLECATIPFFDVNSAALTISSGCAANGATFTPSTALSATVAGDPTLNQSLSPVYGTSYSSPITGGLTTSDGAGTLTIKSTSTNTCVNFSNGTFYDTYAFQPSTSGTYTFTANTSQIYTLYEGTFNAGSPCTGFLNSSGTYNGSTYSTGTTVSSSLCAGKTYTLVASNVAGSLSAYSITISGGTIATNTPNPGAGFNYVYVIVNSTTGNIAAIQSTGNMSNGTTFPTGYYTVYGLSTTSTAAALTAAYPAGTSFNAFNTAINNQTSGLCASLSSNMRSVTVGSIALPLADVRLEAALTGRRSTRASWTIVGSEAGTRQYELERSYDGQAFEPAAVTAAAGIGRYEFADVNLREAAAGVHYRVATRALSGEVRYSATAYLPFESPASPALVVAPNPVQGGVLRAEVGVASTGQGTAVVLDATGRVVLSTPLNLTAGKQRIELPVGGLSAGVYLLRVDGAGAPLQVRFVKSK